ncbi:MAG: hypothetical protein OHK0038_28840 [Flammeovirgaceae bacterium]
MKIITTVGTSIFTNLTHDTDIKKSTNVLRDKKYDEYKRYLDDIEGTEKISQNQGLIKSVWQKIQNKTDASAEISSILKIAEQNPKNDIQIYLISTDTILCTVACKLIKKWFEHYNNNKIQVLFEENEEHIIKNLRVDAQINYEDGFMNLIEVLDKLQLTSDDVLNITGGYKALIPILTIYGQIYEIPLCYIYNEDKNDKNNELIVLGNLPVQFDSLFAESYYPYLQDLKLLNQNDKIIETLKEYKLIEQQENGNRLTVLGQIYKNYVDTHLADSKNVFGFLVEYKVFEHLLKNGYLCKDEKTILKQIERSKKDVNFCAIDNAPVEIDLKISNQNTIVIGEIKSFLDIYREMFFEKFQKQLDRQINGLKVPIKEYALYLYLNNVQESGFKLIKNKQKALKEIENQIKSKFSNCIFRVFLIFITHARVNNPTANSQNNNNKNIYHNFIQAEKINIQEYNLNRK